ncbi:MAG TPA: DUF6292 family protein [Amycolatopsis sp.]|jgi:hypothetical protein|nr:DUF6292 family protein [Amycolatopsis sp.]
MTDREHIPALREYVESVAALLHVEPEASWCEEGNPSTAYIALAEQLLSYPGRLLMAQWSSDSGWRLALEPECGEEPVTLSAWPNPTRPAPTVVARRFRTTLNDLANRRRPPRAARESAGHPRNQPRKAAPHRGGNQPDAGRTSPRPGH